MSRNKIILLNKANGVLKILHEKYQYTMLDVQNYSLEITLSGINALNHEIGEPLIEYFINKNINWTIKFATDKLTIRIW